ncbi:PIN-like domain-containing protein [Paenibacillus sp. S-38]|uniref:PIN-like domain-containing protein n=1 Tax=Paenibacillus sp. S-38 TaxID=3416710 RepID=UPI003CF6CD52
MKGFEAFYKKSPEEIKDMWNECIFVFDANVLLNLYRYSKETKEDLLSIFKNQQNKIWIPHQVALEFHFNRPNVIQDQSDSYGSILSTLNRKSSDFINDLNEDLKEYKKRHPGIIIEDLLSKVSKTIEEVSNQIKQAESEHPDYLDNDPILNELSELFSDSIGEQYDQSKLDQIYQEGDKRYKAKIPPGYKDLEDKKGKKKYWNNLIFSDEYGDLVVWNQIIDKAKTDSVNVVFVTEDEKEDWWQIVNRRVTLGPRIELIEEFRRKTEKSFYMYKTYRFLQFAKETFQHEVRSESIKETQEIGNQISSDLTISEFDKIISYHDMKHYKSLKNSAISIDDKMYAEEWFKNIINNKYEIALVRNKYEVEFVAIIDFNLEKLLQEINKSSLREIITGIDNTSLNYMSGEKNTLYITLNRNVHRNDIRRGLQDIEFIEIQRVMESNF